MAGFQEIHQSARLGKAHPQFALQHGGRPELGPHHKLSSLQQHIQVIANIRIDDGGASSAGRYLSTIFRISLALHVGDDLGDFRLRDPGALDTICLGRTLRQEERITLTDQLVGPWLIKDHARVSHARDGKGEA